MNNEKLLTDLRAILLNATLIYRPEDIVKITFKNGYEDDGEDFGLISELKKIRKVQQAISESNLKLTLQPLTEEEIKEREEHAKIWEKEREEEEKAEKHLETLLNKLPDYSQQNDKVKDIVFYACRLINHESKQEGSFYFMSNAPYIFFWMHSQFGYKTTNEEIKTAMEFVHKFYLTGSEEIEVTPELFLNTYRFVGESYMKECDEFFKIPYLERRNIKETPYLKMEKIILDQVKND